MPTLAEEAAELIATIDDSLTKGYFFFDLRNNPLLNTLAIVNELTYGRGEVTVLAPDNYNPVFDKGRVR